MDRFKRLIEINLMGWETAPTFRKEGIKMGLTKEEEQRFMDELYQEPEYREWIQEQEAEFIKSHKEYYENLTFDVGQYCRDFRMVKLRKTLKQVSDTDNPQTLSGFEFGRSSNFTHLVKYFNACESVELQVDFMKGITSLLIDLKGA